MVTGHRSLLLVVLLLTAPFVAGCVGFASDDEPTESNSVTKQRATVTKETGGIEGIVTDEAVQPVEGANVTLVELDETTTTATDGSFAFSELDPGTYTVAVKADGFLSAQQEADIRANDIVNVDFLLNHLNSQEAYSQTIEWSAFMECAGGAGVNLTAAGQGSGGATIALCNVPNSVLEFAGAGGNATNDQFIRTFEFDPGLTTWVWEATWDTGGNALAENLWLTADIQGHAGLTAGNHTVYVDYSTPSPFHARVERPVFDNITEYFEEQCAEGDDSYCGYAFSDKGWPITVRTFTAYDCLPTPVTACAPLQVEVDHVFSAFYNAPAPEGYSVYEGGSR